jgi:putative DNA modification/repair radical SAM protein
MCQALELLRNEYGFNGYIHAKAIPGTSDELLVRLGVLCDRMSVNIELPSAESLNLLAPQKEGRKLLDPMKFVRDGIHENYQDKRLSLRKHTKFVPAGQSTQMIVGATPETDYQILTLSDSMYKQLELKRVFFSAYLPINDDPLLPPPNETTTPIWREHRLYQADWLMRFYGFNVDEIISDKDPFLDPYLDPKCSWALNNMEYFPAEINRVPYEMLLRIPGVGVKSAKRIIHARRERRLDFDDLKRLGIVMKRARYFITCNGHMSDGMLFDPLHIHNELIRAFLEKHGRGKDGAIEGQLSLFNVDGAAGALPLSAQSPVPGLTHISRHELAVL